MQSCNYHKDVLEVFLVYILCFSIGYDSLGEGLLVDSSEEDPLDLLFIQGTSTDPLFIATCVLDPANDEGGDVFCTILSSCVSEHALVEDSDNSFLLALRGYPFPL